MRKWVRVVVVLLLGWGSILAAAMDDELIRAAGLTPYPVPLNGPAFRLPDRQGEIRAKGDYRGRVVLLNFWGSWCPPCRKEFPSLERLQAQFPHQEFTVLAVTVADSREGVERFIGGREVPFDILIDTTDRTAATYRAAGVPVTYLLDREGRMLAGKAGEMDWDSPAVIQMIRAAIQQ